MKSLSTQNDNIRYTPSSETIRAASLQQMIDYTVSRYKLQIASLQENLYDWKNGIELSPSESTLKFNTCSDYLNNLLLKGKLK